MEGWWKGGESANSTAPAARRGRVDRIVVAEHDRVPRAKNAVRLNLRLAFDQPPRNMKEEVLDPCTQESALISLRAPSPVLGRNSPKSSLALTSSTSIPHSLTISSTLSSSLLLLSSSPLFRPLIPIPSVKPNLLPLLTISPSLPSLTELALEVPPLTPFNPCGPTPNFVLIFLTLAPRVGSGVGGEGGPGGEVVMLGIVLRVLESCRARGGEWSRGIEEGEGWTHSAIERRAVRRSTARREERSPLEPTTWMIRSGDMFWRSSGAREWG